ncbi:MAG TPA: M23 family metallopeptidase [Gammaproteobacteria bacterium]|nr:M23 family metallopeptidase [Gammaproteobacteria bacterium]
MQLVILSKDKGHLGQFSAGRAWFCLGIAAIAICALTFYVGFRVAAAFGVHNPEAQVAEWEAGLKQQERLLASTRAALRQNLDALALRIGQMNAHVVRLDALGSRLTLMAGLNDGEFDFSTIPPLGGPEALVFGADGNQLGRVVETLDRLDLQLTDRSQQLGVLEDLLLNRKLADEVHPEGRPVTTGYISSTFGERSDPFTGRRAFHEGVDFAGREGNDIVAVASGVVTWAGDRYGYGQMVEVNHGNGYATRYAHNAENLVSVGETVKRGDVIARMGDTGRATGPNLHFEVLRDGRAVDPLTVIN